MSQTIARPCRVRRAAPTRAGWTRALALLLLLAGLDSLARAEAALQGPVSALDPGAARLDISGITIVVSNAPIQGEADAALKLKDLKVGDRVDIQGVFSAPRVLAATRVRRTLRGGDRLQGRNEHTDAANRALVVGGITIKVPVNARLEDTESRVLPLEQCTTNHILACSGTWTGTNEFTASRITIK